MKCLKNPADISLWGNYDLASANVLMVVFEKCDPAKSKVTCKSDAEIEQWLKYKYFYGIMNSRIFRTHLFDEERILSRSTTVWFPISSGSRIDYVNIINRYTMQLNDSPFNIGSVTAEMDEGFSLTRLPNRELPYINTWQNAVTIEVSIDRINYNRKVYSNLEYAADLGGLYGAIAPVFGGVVFLINFWGSYQFIMDDLFYGPRRADGNDEGD